MLANPFVLPHADGNVSCVKINQDAYSSEYMNRSSTVETIVKIRHTKTKPDSSGVQKDRHNVEVTQRVFATAEVAEYTRKVYIVIELLPSDLDVKLTDALADWLIATANANVTALLGWES